MTFPRPAIASWLVIIAVLLSANPAFAEKLNIYYSNDMHGKVEPCG